ncbi:MAG: fibronectin type III domain-containing protein [Candidatus Shapirobacteria bacterium]|nr:fibronectin type III domain-containing protein [Candidatus Shapirobacteria bacterium]MDD4410806.1 fibronectin type III domain-containing protein [Candidatus Shapirobacteria bacterium]
MKKFFIPLFLILSLFLSKPIFAGNDITITCNSGSECTKSSELPLFDETNIYPGFTKSQNFYIDNNRNAPCQLKFKAVSSSQIPDVLSQKILINILATNNENDYSLVNYSLSDLLDPNKPVVSLGHVNKDKKNSYLWSVTFDSEATNVYQNLNTNFGINFNFECDEETGDVLSSISDNPSSNQGTAECTNSVPTAPTRFYAVANSSGSITLHWTHSTSPHTGYLIAYGPNPNNYIYGNPNVGNEDFYTVGSLTPGAQYCFYVRSLNGCMPGGRTPEYCINPGATVTPTNIIPTGFQPNVLGDTTENNSIEEPKILGSQDSSCTKHWLPLLFIVAFLINLIYFRLPTKDILIPIIISLTTYFIDSRLLKSHCCFGPSWLCNYFWIGNILSGLIPILIKIKSKKA